MSIFACVFTTPCFLWLITVILTESEAEMSVKCQACHCNFLKFLFSLLSIDCRYNGMQWNAVPVKFWDVKKKRWKFLLIRRQLTTTITKDKIFSIFLSTPFLSLYLYISIILRIYPSIRLCIYLSVLIFILVYPKLLCKVGRQKAEQWCQHLLTNLSVDNRQVFNSGD